MRRVSISLIMIGASACAYQSRDADANDGAGAMPNQLTAAQVQDGWELVFDGESVDGWRGHRRQDVPASWQAVDGTLRFSPSADRNARGDIMTVAQYDDFELSLEWKIGPAGNSGIMFRVTEEEDRAWKTATEMQVLDNAGHRDGRNPLTSAGSNYALYAPSSDVTRPVGEWNEARIKAVGGDVEFWLNGTLVVTFQMWSEDWEERVRGSKFIEHPRYGRAARGHIDFQDHGDPVSYRNIRIRRIGD